MKEDIVFSLNSETAFTLTCITTGGPATTVEWTRNGKRIYFISSVVVDTQHSTYEHRMSSWGRFLGLYSVNVSNSRTPSTVSQYNVTGKEIMH